MNSTKAGLLQRWRRFAQRAAQAQSTAVLWLLYYVIFVPIALGRPSRWRRPRPGHAAPAWQPRTTRTADLPSARRQF